MKKLIFTVLLILCFGLLSADPVYKGFTINGKKINKWVEFDSLVEYNANGNEIYKKDTYSGTERWYQYDSNGNKTCEKNSNDKYTYEHWYEYDSNSNLIHEKYSNGFGSEYWAEYDSNSNKIYEKTTFGTEIWYEYNSDRNLIHTKFSDGSEYWYEYEFHPNGKIKKQTCYKNI